MAKKAIKEKTIFLSEATSQANTLGTQFPTRGEVNKKFENVNYVLLGVILILLVMVATLIIESFRFNSVVYKEYSEKMENVEEVKKINNILLEENRNIQNTITENQETIKNLLRQL